MKELANRLNERSVYLNNGCIETTWKNTQRGGHTVVGIGGKKKLAHRLAWEAFKGEIPSKMQINHKCNNARCINVEHLYVGTQKDNINDSIRAGTHITATVVRIKPLTDNEKKESRKQANLRYYTNHIKGGDPMYSASEGRMRRYKILTHENRS